jgi:3-isopropylmalate/(R)-2-methylmalate dehydratase small subunit
MNWEYRGRCWKFGDNLGIDGDIMPLEFAIKRETDPDVLRDYVMHERDPEFAKKARPGDIIVAGRRFAQGNPHIQGFIGIRGLGLGLVAESIPRGSVRNAINAAVPFLTGCTGVRELCETGDQLRVDFRSGVFVNETRGVEQHYAPLDAQLLAIIEAGGWEPNLRRRLESMRQDSHT